MLSKQMFYHLSHTFKPYLLYFSDRILLSSDHNPPTYVTQVDVITGMIHHALFDVPGVHLFSLLYNILQYDI
jgi:hypothetical protein